ncbi:glycoside hydrolase family 3 N-terminal domain-containing protein [Agromyces mangrovi Wang et al. 2018]|uniref:glycoside hydrolase family 3 N-terminal domain-containing protein n=1 Tax=Agromyces mangrovi TaxID=1858653 RepID=UPI00257407E7|nr:glycoside hydrolase family 3 N-terminal domain-containing protein [Agromyces mangrovi]BDZ65082.1 beta-glucosidase [Agromyces mangrovi]
MNTETTSDRTVGALRPVDVRVDDLISRMTLEEKAGQLTQYFYFGTSDALTDDEIEALPGEQQSAARQSKLVTSAIASGRAGSALFVSDPQLANRLQRYAVDESRLGIPLMFGFDVIHGMRTIFPVPIALAASWNPETIETAQAVAAREARAHGIHWAFAPMIDVARDARWGRIVEGAGEDPYLAAKVAAAQVRGFQGDLGSDRILAGPKHFAGYGAARGGRDYEDAEISDSEFYNVYLPPFRAAIEAGAGNIMSAYMDLNGVPASGNPWLLTQVLRGELGFDGFTVSDANAVKSLQTQHFAASSHDAAVRAVNAGLDMEMCMFDPAFANLPAAVAAGQVDEAVLDAAVRRVLTAKIELGLFEHPYVDETAAVEVLADPAHRERAKDAATRSTVLLKNDAILPLDPAARESIAVIGQLADSPRDTIGPWVFAYDIDETVTILDGIRAQVGDAATVAHAPGASIPGRLYPSLFDGSDRHLAVTPADYDDDAEIERAVALADASDIAVVVVGERQNQIGELASRSSLDLPGRQLEQLQRIAATGTPIVLLVMSGRPLDLRWADDNVPAIAQVWYPGTRGGEAIAALLFGEASPAGRLPFTWPRHVGHVPVTYAHLNTFEPQNADKRYWDEESTPLYPFGHGLGYGSFEYTDLRVDREAIPIGGAVTVAVDVTNTSGRDADEVVQLYLHQRHGRASRPVRELKGFSRVSIGAGDTRTVTFDIGPAELRYWSAATREWVQDATEFDVWVGGSSAATLACEFAVTGIAAEGAVE